MQGRPTKYKAEYVKTAKKLCELGATIPDLAEAFGVAVSTVNLWTVKHKPFSDALKVGKSKADDRVERSLYERANGYQHEEDDIRVVGGAIEITPTIKRYPPDTTACIYWLNNRRPDQYRARPPEILDDDPPEGQTVKIIVEDARKPDS